MSPELASAIQEAVNDVFESNIQTYSPTRRDLMLTSLGVIRGVGYVLFYSGQSMNSYSLKRLRNLSLPAAFDLLASCTSGHDTGTYTLNMKCLAACLMISVIILGLYRLFKKFDSPTLHTVEKRTQISLIDTIRGYLTSGTPNEVYLFLSCLESVDPSLWAGTSDAIPAVLEAWEVERIMQLLDSDDGLIRKKVIEAVSSAPARVTYVMFTQTLHLLGEVDQNIVNAYYTQAISVTTRIALPLKELNERVKRLLEILEALSGDSGELYATQVKDLLSRIEPHVAGNGILDSAVEGVLAHIRLSKAFNVVFICSPVTRTEYCQGEPSFQIPCAATMLTILCDTDAGFGPTMVIILVALATEYSRLVSLSPADLLTGICHRLKGNLCAYTKE